MSVILLCLALLAACENPGILHPLAAQIGNDSATTPNPEPSSGLTPSPVAPTATPEPLQDTVQISLKDFRLDPDQVTARAGTVTFVLKNEGRFTHDFRVEGPGPDLPDCCEVDEKAPKVGRGRTREWQITLEPGSYRISCPISNHADRGMTGTLMVVA